MSRLPQPHSAPRRIEHLHDFTSLDWCQDLLADPSITRIQKRQAQEQREGVSDTLFSKTLFTDEALRAYLSMYRLGSFDREHNENEVFTGNVVPAGPSKTIRDSITPSVLSKEEQVWSPTDPDTPEMIILVSIGQDLDGAVRRLHGGITATLLDQVMGHLVAYVYDNTCATADLNTKYKVAVTTPCVLLCRAKMIRNKGRWVETVGWIEDGQGKVFAEGKGSFVLNKITPIAAAAKI